MNISYKARLDLKINRQNIKKARDVSRIRMIPCFLFMLKFLIHILFL